MPTTRRASLAAGAKHPRDDPEEVEDREAATDDAPLTVEERVKATEEVWRLYNSGAPLYTAATLKRIDDELAKRPRTVRVHDIDGRERILNAAMFWLNRGESQGIDRIDWTSPHIGFGTIQDLTNPSPRESVTRRDLYCPLQIYFRQPLSFRRRNGAGLEDTVVSFDRYRERWEAGETCRQLKETLSGVELPKRITKVVGFGLGCLEAQAGDDDDDNDMEQRGHARSHFQHAALLTMAQIARERTGCRVAVYAQDPAYQESCRRALAARGAAVLDGVGGFLAVDAETLVFSVSPNVPVKQVVAELARPAVVVWDAMADRESPRWRLQEWPSEGGGEREKYWLAPHSTDPDSPRTRDMLQDGYTALPFPEDLRHFGSLTIYVRND